MKMSQPYRKITILSLILFVILLVSGTISVKAQVVVTAYDTTTNCFGDEGVRVRVTATGGTQEYNYILYNTSNVEIATAPNAGDEVFFENVNPGSYYVQASNNDNVSSLSTDFFNVSEALELENGQINVIEPLSCFDSQDMVVEASITGGTEPYSYLWFDGLAAGQTSGTVENLDNQSITVQITDVYNCKTVEIVAYQRTLSPPDITINHVSLFPSCDGETGVISIYAMQVWEVADSLDTDYSALEYSLENISTSEVFSSSNSTISSLPSGWYTPYVTNTSSGCVKQGNNVQLNTIAQPIAPTLTKDPIDANVCVGAELNVNSGSGSGGPSDAVDEYRNYTASTGWSAWSSTIPSFSAIIGSNRVQSRRSANDYGCNTSVINEVSWTAIADPVATGLTKIPNIASVCEGAELAVSFNTAGTGGTGASIKNLYRYTSNGGLSWSDWDPAIQSFNAGLGTEKNRYQSTRVANGIGCESDTIEIIWNGESEPIAAELSKLPNGGSVCRGGSVSATVATAGSGGVNCADQLYYRLNNGLWLTYVAGNSVATNNTTTTVEIISVRGNCTSGAICTADTNYYTWTIDSPPDATAYGGSGCGLTATLLVAQNIGDSDWEVISGPGSIVSWQTDGIPQRTQVSVTQYGTYQLSWNIDVDGCTNADTVEVTFNRLPEAYAGSDGRACFDSAYTILDAATSNAQSLVWVTSGDGEFDDDEILKTTYYPGKNDKEIGSVKIYLEANGYGSCQPAIDSMILTIPARLKTRMVAPMPFPISSNTEIIIHIETDGHFPNQDLSYFLVAPDRTKRVVLKETPLRYLDWSTECNTGEDVDIYFKNILDENDTLKICDGPNPNSKIVATVNATGNWSNIYGLNPAESGWSVELYDYINTGIGYEGNIVHSSITFIDINQVTGVVDSVSFDTRDTLVYINNPLNSGEFAVSEISVPIEFSVPCKNSCDLPISITTSGGVKPYAPYEWNTAPSVGSEPDLVYLCAGDYNLTVTDAMGCEAKTNLFVSTPDGIVIDEIEVTDTLTCSNDDIGVINVKASGGTGTLKYLLNGTIASESTEKGSFTNLAAGSYTLSITDGYKCPFDTTIIITSGEPLVVKFNIVPVQENKSPGSLTIGPKNGEAPYTIWFDSSWVENVDRVYDPLTDATATYDNLSQRFYYAAIQDGRGCIWDDSIYIRREALDVTVLASDDFCGGSRDLTIIVKDGTPPFHIYRGTETDTTLMQVINDTPPFTYAYDVDSGRYYIYIDNATELYFDTTVVVASPTEINLETNYTQKTCQTVDLNGNKTLDGAIYASADGGIGDLTFDLYAITPIAGIDDIHLENSTEGIFEGLGKNLYYRVKVTDEKGCSQTDSINLEGVHRFYSYLQNDMTLCESKELKLYGGIGNFEYSVLWGPEEYFENPRADTQNIILKDSITISITISDSTCKFTDWVTFDVYDPIGMDFIVDAGGYVWDTAVNTVYPNTETVLTVALPGMYDYVTLLDSTYAGLMPGDRVDEIPMMPLQNGYYEIFVEEGIGNYMVATGITNEGCVETDTIFITIRQSINETYNVFTPNSDGINDFWVIDHAEEFPEIEVEIYDRWGQLVFYRIGYGKYNSTNNMWDGRSMKSGEDLPVGTYMYIIKPNDGISDPITGSVTILR